MDNMEIDKDSLIEEFRSLNKYDAEFSKRCKKISSELQTENLTIVQLIEQLKELLVNQSHDSRELGMLILSHVLESLPRDQLNEAQLTFICSFYSDRLNDHHQVIPAALKGVLAIMNFKNVPKDSAKEIMNSLFKNVPCQQQQQADRYNIYKILEAFLEMQNAGAHELSYDFVYGVISAMDSERDPRNLLHLFKWLPKFIQDFHLGHLAEEMFEVMACYFPVDFRAPTQDSNSVSRETLAANLCSCLCATPEFAEYCFPLVLEKLSSSLQIAKIDSLNVLAEGCRTFEVPFYVQHANEIWSQIQKEIINCNDRELEAAALKTLEIVMNKLSHAQIDIFQRILDDITDTLKGNLVPHMKLFETSCKILFHVAKGSETSADHVILQIVPILINTYNITLTTSHQVVVFKRLIDFVRVYIEVHGNDDIMKIEELKVVPNLCLKSILHPEDEIKAVGFQSLSVLAKSLSFETRKCLLENLRLLFTMPKSDLVNESFLICFKVMSQTYSEEVQDYVLNDVKVDNLESLKLYLDTLSVIVYQEAFTKKVLLIFMENCDRDIKTVHVTTGSLRRLLEHHEDNKEIQQILVHNQLINKFINWIADHISKISDSYTPILVNISHICKIIIGFQDSETQNKIVDGVLGKVVNLYKNTRNYLLLIVFDGLLTRLRRDVKFDYDIMEDLLDAALNVKENDELQQIVFQLLANILNKSEEDIKFENDLKNILIYCNNTLEDATDECLQTNAINAISWVTKALVMRGQRMSEMFVNTLLDLLETKFATYAAKGLKIIMNDNCESLSTKSYSDKRLLYRQKFFTEVSNKLTENYKEESASYLLAIGYLLQEAPRPVFILHFKKIFRLVILCLEQCKEPEVLRTVLETLGNLIENKEFLAEEYLQEILPRLLKLTTFQPSMQVRIKALQCLQNYSQGYPLYKLIPHKQTVIHALVPCLDDKKRLVRKEAVEARLRWFLLDAPT